jgi:hypothetical protein
MIHHLAGSVTVKLNVYDLAAATGGAASCDAPLYQALHLIFDQR